MARASGIDKTRDKETHRLGSVAASVSASTWHTSATAYVSKDGSGYVVVKRDGVELHYYHFEAEGK